MRTVLGLIASLLVNGAVLGSIEWMAQQVPPAGEVTIVQARRAGVRADEANLVSEAPHFRAAHGGSRIGRSRR